MSLYSLYSNMNYCKLKTQIYRALQQLELKLPNSRMSRNIVHLYIQILNLTRLAILTNNKNVVSSYGQHVHCLDLTADMPVDMTRYLSHPPVSAVDLGVCSRYCQVTCSHGRTGRNMANSADE